MVLALGGGAVVGNALQSSPPSVTFHWREARSVAGSVHLTVMYRALTSGTRVQANVTGIAPGTVCELQAIDSHGQAWALGSWQDWSESAWYPGQVGVTDANIRTFELTVQGKVVASARA